jgi:hypothetical protein
MFLARAPPLGPHARSSTNFDFGDMTRAGLTLVFSTYSENDQTSSKLDQRHRSKTLDPQLLAPYTRRLRRYNEMSTIKVADVVVSPQTFYVDAVLFDMDGTMVDSSRPAVFEWVSTWYWRQVTAVEKAWGGVAVELHKDPDEVIAATHGRRAIDVRVSLISEICAYRSSQNLRDLKPELVKTPDEAMDPHVTEFETRILNEADAFSKEVRSRRESVVSSRVSSLAISAPVRWPCLQNASRRASRAGSQSGTPREGSTPGSRTGSKPGSRSNSLGPSRQNSISGGRPARGSFANELSKRFVSVFDLFHADGYR